MEVEGKVYLRGLYGFRFLAAFSVFYGHLEQAKVWAGVPPWLFRASPRIAGEGVTCFFVLSGFLISYLLFVEERKTFSINLKSFYWRRMLRIWPLYYAWTLLVFFVFPFIPFMRFPILGTTLDGDFTHRLILFLFLSPHIATSLYSHPPFGGPLWSIGVEEYFYVTWPLLLKKIAKKILPLILIVFICAMPVLRAILSHDSPPWVVALMAMCRFDCMAIGAFFAWICIENKDWLDLIFQKRWIHWITWFCAFIHAVFGMNYGILTETIYSVVYGLLIVDVAFNPIPLFSLENPFLTFMGKISYGFYVIHWAVIVLVINIFIQFSNIQNKFFLNFLIFAISFGLTTALSMTSYFGFERRFLFMKKRYSHVEHGEA